MRVPTLGRTTQLGGNPPRTVARDTLTRKNPMIVTSVIAACVINGDSLTDVLTKATGFLWVLVVLITVRTLASIVERRTA